MPTSALPQPEPEFGICLENTWVGDGNLKYLAGFKQLRALSLKDTGITDASVKELLPLEQLTYLDLTNTKLTDAGLKHVGQLKQLQFLLLESTKVTDAGVKELAGLGRLRSSPSVRNWRRRTTCSCAVAPRRSCARSGWPCVTSSRGADWPRPTR